VPEGQRELDVLSSLREGGADALAWLFAANRERLRLAVSLRLDRRLRGRIDPSDVLQDAYLEAAGRLDDFLREAKMAPHLWVRFLTMQQLQIAHRRHLGTQARDAGRELPLEQACGEVSSEGLAACLAASDTSPTQAAEQQERRAYLERALARLDGPERELISLRHFEGLSTAEVALVLGVQPGAASQRYFRAMKRLREALAELSAGLWEV
jgi:RNA polymerase sigma-70 factor (ECF subfamily)